MNRRKIERECRALFPKLRPCVVRWIEASFPDGESWHGLFCPGSLKNDSVRSDTILLNLHYAEGEMGDRTMENFMRGILIHELIHLEQWTMGHNPSHGTYFKQRRAELRAKTGINIP